MFFLCFRVGKVAKKVREIPVISCISEKMRKIGQKTVFAVFFRLTNSRRSYYTSKSVSSLKKMRPRERIAGREIRRNGNGTEV
jgi:hypothetical protein